MYMVYRWMSPVSYLTHCQCIGLLQNCSSIVELLSVMGSIQVCINVTYCHWNSTYDILHAILLIKDYNNHRNHGYIIIVWKWPTYVIIISH